MENILPHCTRGMKGDFKDKEINKTSPDPSLLKRGYFRNNAEDNVFVYR